jgi:transcriptional regulator with XRE-family HTH domain
MVSEVKVPDPVDVHAGAQVRRRRRSMGISQQSLADMLHVTFQQVQKYERGANRISASKLHAISTALHVPVAYFFEGIVDGQVIEEDEELATARRIRALLHSAEGLELASMFFRVTSTQRRRTILEVLRTLVNEEARSPSR